MARDDIYRQVLEYPYWRQQIDLGDGRHTFGTRDASDWERLALPADLTGQSFLDVGTSDGLHAFEAERRGAEEVLAVDVWEESTGGEWWYGRTPRREGFELVAEYLESDVSGRRLDVRDLDPETVGTFDVVLCSKVLPFVQCPGEAVQALVEVTDGLLVLESATSVPVGHMDAPGFQFAKATSGNDNRWWHPNVSGLEALVQWAHGLHSDGREATVRGELVSGDAVAEDVCPRRTTRPNVTVYRDPELSDAVDAVPGDCSVTAVGAYDDARRIEYQLEDGEPHRQGWVDEASLAAPKGSSGITSEASSLVREVAEYVRRGDLEALPSKAMDYVRYRFSDYADSNVLVHYSVENTSRTNGADARP